MNELTTESDILAADPAVNAPPAETAGMDDLSSFAHSSPEISRFAQASNDTSEGRSEMTADEPAAEENGDLTDMMKAGIHFGHAKSKSHPSMKPYIYGIRNTISVIDLAETQKALKRAADFLTQSTTEGKMILFVGTRPAARAIVRDVAQKTNMPYVTERWLGGTMTNFSIIRQRVDYLERLEREKKTGEMEKYTKKERMEKTKEMERLGKNFDGLRRMTRPADILCVVNIGEDCTAIREARRKNIPIVALADTNSDITGITYPIPSNDDALPAVRYMMTRIGDAVEEGIRRRNTGSTLAKE